MLIYIKDEGALIVIEAGLFKKLAVAPICTPLTDKRSSMGGQASSRTRGTQCSPSVASCQPQPTTQKTAPAIGEWTKKPNRTGLGLGNFTTSLPLKTASTPYPAAA